MEVDMGEQKLPFLQGGGEMGEVINDYNSEPTSLGPFHNWPVSLRVQISMMLKSRFPMLIFWGADTITFYNDAFCPILKQAGRHPSSLGQSGEHSWAESWQVIGPIVYNIMAGGEAVTFEDQKQRFYPDGRMGDACRTFSYSPLINDAGEVDRVLVACPETTKLVEGLGQLQYTNQRLNNLFEDSRQP